MLLGAADRAGAQTASVAELPPHLPNSTHGAAPAAPAVYFAADQMLALPGGAEALLKFLGSKVNYSAAALDRAVSGKVHVAFTVDPSGHLHDPHVVRGLGFGLDEEALRLVRIMLWWEPGKINGQPVWVSVTMPIVFRAL